MDRLLRSATELLAVLLLTGLVAPGATADESAAEPTVTASAESPTVPADIIPDGWKRDGEHWFYYEKGAKRTGWLTEGASGTVSPPTGPWRPTGPGSEAPGTTSVEAGNGLRELPPAPVGLRSRGTRIVGSTTVRDSSFTTRPWPSSASQIRRTRSARATGRLRGDHSPSDVR